VHDEKIYCERHYAELVKPRCNACDEVSDLLLLHIEINYGLNPGYVNIFIQFQFSISIKIAEQTNCFPLVYFLWFLFCCITMFTIEIGLLDGNERDVVF
jgi:hypothetical protein